MPPTDASATSFPPVNAFGRVLARLDRWPDDWRLRLVGLGFGLYTPYFRTNRCRVLAIEPLRVTVGIALRRRVRNHVGGVHAVAATLAGEYASGLLVGQHVPDQAIVVVKAIHVDLRKPYRGDVRATAVLTAEQARAIRDEPKGSLRVPVVVEDAQGLAPIDGYMEMAWFLRKRP